MNRQPFKAIRNMGGMETTGQRQPGRRMLSRNKSTVEGHPKVTGRSPWALTNSPFADKRRRAKTIRLSPDLR
jgi:hypothetical protein